MKYLFNMNIFANNFVYVSLNAVFFLRFNKFSSIEKRVHLMVLLLLLLPLAFR